MSSKLQNLKLEFSEADLHDIQTGSPLVAQIEPDSAVETFDERQPPYETAISLPYVVRRGSTVWGFSGQVFLSHSPGKGIYGLNSFGFTNAGPIYAILTYTSSLDAVGQPSIAVRLLPVASFKSFRLEVRKSCSVVWNSKTARDISELRRSMTDGNSHAVCIEIEDEVSLTAPASAIYCRLESETFEVRTRLEPFPAFALACDRLLQEITDRNPEMLDATVRTARSFHLNDSVLSTFVCAASDGTFYSAADIHSARRQRYQAMTILK